MQYEKKKMDGLPERIYSTKLLKIIEKISPGKVGTPACNNAVAMQG